MTTKKQLIGTFILFCSAFLVLGQQGQWAFGAGDWTDDYANEITLDEDGNIYVTGRLTSGTTIGDQTFDSWGAYLFKLNADGEVVWARSFANSHTASGIDVAIDSNGDVLLLGSSGHFFEIDGYQVLNRGQFVIKFDADGNTLWVKDYDYFQGTAIQVDSEDNFYIGGSFTDNIVLEGITYSITGREGFDRDGMLLKFDKDGNVVWVRTPGSVSEEVFLDMDIRGDRIVVAGYMRGTELETVSGTFTAASGTQGFAMEYGLDGDVNWFRGLQAPYYSYVHSVSLDSELEAVISGTWWEGNVDSLHFKFIAKLSGEGKVLYNQTIRHSSTASGIGKRWDLSTEGREVYLSAGWRTPRQVGPLTYDSEEYNVVQLKLNEVGFPQWLSATSAPASIKSVEVQNSQIYMAGEYSGTEMTWGESTIMNNSGNNNRDFFVVKSLDVTTENDCPSYDANKLVFDNHFCEGDSALLRIEGNYAAYTKWSRDNVALPWDDQKAVYLKEPGTYLVNINESTRCPADPLSIKVSWDDEQDSDTDIVVIRKPGEGISGPDQICLFDTLILSTTFNEDYLYQWSTSSGYDIENDISHEASVVISSAVLSPLFKLHVTDKSTGCVREDSTVIEVREVPSIFVSQSDRVLTASTSTENTIKWYLDGVELDAFEGDESIVATDPGLYWAVATNVNGCTSASNEVLMDAILSVADQEDSPVLYPNPVSEAIQIRSPHLPELLEVFDFSGRLMLTQTNNRSMSVAHLEAGVYLLRVTSGKGITTLKFRKN